MNTSKLNFKISIFIIILLLIFLTLFISYKISDKNIGKNIVISSIFIDDNNNIVSSSTKIFKLDSNGKCINTKFIMTSENDTSLKQINESILNGYDTENELSNVELHDYTLYFDNNEFNGLNEDEIKGNLYNKYIEEGNSNIKYHVKVSISEF